MLSGVVAVNALVLNILECHSMRADVASLMKKPALIEKLMAANLALQHECEANGWLQTLPRSVGTELAQVLAQQVEGFCSLIQERLISVLDEARVAVADLTGGLRRGESWKEGLSESAPWDEVLPRVTVLMRGEASQEVYDGYNVLREDLTQRTSHTLIDQRCECK